MAHENLELARSIFAGWERGDFFTWGDWAHPDIEFELADLPGAKTRTGDWA
jgi:ketosteroid isomerase-like protein